MRQTKAARRQAALAAHYATLERLAAACGVKQPNGKRLSVALLKLEREAHQGAEDYCNGVRFGDDQNVEWEAFSDDIKARVQALFGGQLQGLQINGDARGYALKIDDEVERTVYAAVRLHRDMGGYGILAPELGDA